MQEMKVLWNFNIYTGHLLTTRHVAIDKLQKTVQIVDVSVPSDCNVAKKKKKKLKNTGICQLNSHHYGEWSVKLYLWLWVDLVVQLTFRLENSIGHSVI